MSVYKLALHGEFLRVLITVQVRLTVHTSELELFES